MVEKRRNLDINIGMNEEQFETFIETGQWLTKQTDDLNKDIKKNGYSEERWLKADEIIGRIKQWNNDLKKIVNEMNNE
jgi:hypothetical protein